MKVSEYEGSPGLTPSPTRSFQFRVIRRFSFPLTGAAERTQSALILAAHPYMNHNKIKIKYNSLHEYLAVRLKPELDIRVDETHRQYSAAVDHKQVYIAYMRPASDVTLVALLDGGTV